jgi:hypothetical protein
MQPKKVKCYKSQKVSTVEGGPAQAHPWCMIPTSLSEKKQSWTLNHKPQLGPQHRHHHEEVWKNGISYTVGLMRSMAYCRICLVNKKTAIVAKTTPHVGINSKQEAGEYVRYPFLVVLLGCIVLRLRVPR